MDRTAAIEDAATQRFHAWVGGDADAGRRFVEHFYRDIFRFFCDKVGPEPARDLAQETFETLVARKDRFRGESDIRAFLYGIARWKLVHYFERKRLVGERFEPATDSVNIPAVEASITSVFSGRQREVLLVRALRSLALDDQIILELKDFEGMSAREIGAVFGVGRDTISSRITRARRRLSAAVEVLTAATPLAPDTDANLHDELRRIRQLIADANLA